LDDPRLELVVEGLEFSVQGQPWPFHAKALVMLHKPVGYECSAKPRHHPSILTLLPALSVARAATLQAGLHTDQRSTIAGK